MSNKGQKKEKEQVIDTVRLKPAGQVQLVPTKEPSPLLQTKEFINVVRCL
jgi:hypothetical protein